MTSEDNFKRRCIIKKLDFENCIVTNIKTKARGRKRLRARITREFGSLDWSQKEATNSQQFSQTTENVISEPTSPVLIKKQHKSKDSPIFSKKKKINLDESEDNFSSLAEEIPSAPNSPVFKIKIPKFLNMSMSQSQKTRNSLHSDGSSKKAESDFFFAKRNLSSGSSQTCYKIDEFTQESVKDVDISSVESEDMKVRGSKSSGEIIVESSEDTTKTSGSFNSHDSKPYLPEVIETPVKKKYKKNSLLDRLQKVLRKKASEKLIWRHQKRKGSPGKCKKVVVLNYWNIDCNFILKCQTLSDTEPEINFVIIDSQWVPNVKQIKTGSVLQLYPPWQQFYVKESKAPVLLNMICVEIVGEVKEPNDKQCRLESVPVDKIQLDPNMFVESLFSTRISELLL